MVMNMFYGIVMAVFAQALTFLQLQGSAKWGWYQKYPIPMLLLAIPISWLFIKSVDIFVTEYGGEIWPSRLIGFGVGIVTFYFMSYYVFNESVSLKTAVCLVLSVSIILIQLFWK
jgi:hypothetical protein